MLGESPGGGGSDFLPRESRSPSPRDCVPTKPTGLEGICPVKPDDGTPKELAGALKDPPEASAPPRGEAGLPRKAEEFAGGSTTERPGKGLPASQSSGNPAAQSPASCSRGGEGALGRASANEGRASTRYPSSARNPSSVNSAGKVGRSCEEVSAGNIQSALLAGRLKTGSVAPARARSPGPVTSARTDNRFPGGFLSSRTSTLGWKDFPSPAGLRLRPPARLDRSLVRKPSPVPEDGVCTNG